jgi:hypothetical protein
VIVASKDVGEVDNDYFLIPVKILDHEGALYTSFPVENRLLPQGGCLGPGSGLCLSWTTHALDCTARWGATCWCRISVRPAACTSLLTCTAVCLRLLRKMGPRLSWIQTQ